MYLWAYSAADITDCFYIFSSTWQGQYLYVVYKFLALDSRVTARKTPVNVPEISESTVERFEVFTFRKSLIIWNRF
jgi:hypothetical protein